MPQTERRSRKKLSWLTKWNFKIPWWRPISKKESLSKLTFTTLNQNKLNYGVRVRQNLIKEGDENTTFFHRVCSINQRKNWIKEIKDPNEVPHNSTNSISKVFLGHFKVVYSMEDHETLWISNLDWKPTNSSH